jgi:hypothetical protein
MKRPVLVLATSSAVLAIFLGILLLIRTRAPHIPSIIGDEEYELYSDWAISHFSKTPQGKLYLLSRTFKFNPFEQPSGCSHTMIENTGVPRSLTRQLRDLGDAEYLFKDNPPVRLRIPWKYALIDSSPDLPPGTFDLLAFSRVAFSRDHRQALFAVSDACAYGDCGRGGAVYAHKDGGQWTFKSAGCLWLF